MDIFNLDALAEAEDAACQLEAAFPVPPTAPSSPMVHAAVATLEHNGSIYGAPIPMSRSASQSSLTPLVVASIYETVMLPKAMRAAEASGEGQSAQPKPAAGRSSHTVFPAMARVEAAMPTPSELHQQEKVVHATEFGGRHVA